MCDDYTELNNEAMDLNSTYTKKNGKVNVNDLYINVIQTE